MTRVTLCSFSRAASPTRRVASWTRRFWWWGGTTSRSPPPKHSPRTSRSSSRACRSRRPRAACTPAGSRYPRRIVRACRLPCRGRPPATRASRSWRSAWTAWRTTRRTWSLSCLTKRAALVTRASPTAANNVSTRFCFVWRPGTRPDARCWVTAATMTRTFATHRSSAWTISFSR